ncbi:hypothetical protein JCM10207_004404 [Rhodosporidiobolus poonsookiae]
MSASLSLPRTRITTASGRFETVYHASSLDPDKTTLVFVNSYATSIDLYVPQFNEELLTSRYNLLAIGLLGHEKEAKFLVGTDSFTYWDQAALVLEVLETLDVKKAFLLGTSQGGFISARAAIRGGSRIQGVIACGSTFASEATYNSYFQDLCDQFASDTPDFAVPEEYRKWFIHLGWGDNVDPTLEAFWRKTLEDRFNGPEGQRRLWQITTNLLERDQLRNRLQDFHCPLMILHGSEDVAISMGRIEHQMTWFRKEIPKELHFIHGGTHYLTQSNPKECNDYIISFLDKHSNALSGK